MKQNYKDAKANYKEEVGSDYEITDGESEPDYDGKEQEDEGSVSLKKIIIQRYPSHWSNYFVFLCHSYLVRDRARWYLKITKRSFSFSTLLAVSELCTINTMKKWKNEKILLLEFGIVLQFTIENVKMKFTYT